MQENEEFCHLHSPLALLEQIALDCHYHQVPLMLPLGIREGPPRPKNSNCNPWLCSTMLLYPLHPYPQSRFCTRGALRSTLWPTVWDWSCDQDDVLSTLVFFCHAGCPLSLPTAGTILFNDFELFRLAFFCLRGFHLSHGNGLRTLHMHAAPIFMTDYDFGSDLCGGTLPK